MPITVSIEEIQGNLKELILQLAPGDELIITENSQPIAALTSRASEQSSVRKPGLGKGMLIIDSDDEHHLADFEEYMP